MELFIATTIMTVSALLTIGFTLYILKMMKQTYLKIGRLETMSEKILGAVKDLGLQKKIYPDKEKSVPLNPSVTTSPQPQKQFSKQPIIVASKKKPTFQKHENMPKRPEKMKWPLPKTANQSQTLVSRDKIEETFFYSDIVVSELLRYAIDHNWVEVFSQPIVNLPQRQVVSIEYFARLRAGKGIYLGADQYMDIAQREDMMNELDRVHLIHVMNNIMDSDIQHDIVLNIKPSHLLDKAYIQTLAKCLKADQDLGKRVILEMSQIDTIHLGPKHHAVIRALRQAGLRFSLDHILDQNIDFETLRELGFTMIKFDAKTLQDFVVSDHAYAFFTQLYNRLKSIGMKITAIKVEDEQTVLDLNDLGVAQAQGYHFYKPERQALNNGNLTYAPNIVKRRSA